jgi:hypothetical protein
MKAGHFANQIYCHPTLELCLREAILCWIIFSLISASLPDPFAEMKVRNQVCLNTLLPSSIRPRQHFDSST